MVFTSNYPTFRIISDTFCKFSREVFPDVLEIDEYHGTRPIARLPVYPLQYHNDNDGVYSRAVELGKRLVQLPTHSFHEISGRASRSVGRGQREPKFVCLQLCNPLLFLS